MPDAFSINLDQLTAISLKGEEQTKYLQGQVTCDVNQLSDNNWLFGAHCNAKGKMFSAFRLASFQQQYLMIQPRSTVDSSLAELQKIWRFCQSRHKRSH